jgi:two-component system, OmpR family, response regulator
MKSVRGRFRVREPALSLEAMKILVIEDDPTVGQFVKRGLEEQRWGVDLVANGEDGERRATSEAYDLVILDMRLPGKSGLEVLHGLRARGFERPVLVLTAQDALDAKVQTLRAGADDYVTKPFAFEELLARVEALSRRPRALASRQLRVDDLTLDQDTREVLRAGEPVDLTPKEYAVLEYLMRHAGKVMSRTLITEYAWGYHFDPGTNIVDVLINHLRKKVDAKWDRKLITTVRGVGYVIKA